MVAWSDNSTIFRSPWLAAHDVPYRAGFRSMRRMTVCGFGG